MSNIDRRAFLAGSSVAVAGRVLRAAAGSSGVDETLRNGIASRGLPAVVAMAAGEKKALYAGAFGTRDTSGVAVHIDSIFAIASMTKAVTTVAALQLVEQGKVDLAEPVSRHLPELTNLDVAEGFDADGKPQLRPARTPITLRHLLTHTPAAFVMTPGMETCFGMRRRVLRPLQPSPARSCSSQGSGGSTGKAWIGPDV